MMRGLNYQNRVMRSITTFAVPVTLVAAMSVPTVVASMWIGRLADKVDTVLQTTNEIKQGQYTQSDAAKDLALVHTEISDIKRRVEVLEHHHVQLARQDFITRAGKWLSGK